MAASATAEPLLLKDFLLNAAKEVQGKIDAGELKGRDARQAGREVDKISRICRNNRRMKNLEERVELEAHRKGVDKKLKSLNKAVYGAANGIYGFDWSGLISFLKELFPLILSFIDAIN